MRSSAAEPLEPVSFSHRFLWASVAWLLIAASQPGLGRSQGFGHTGMVALAPWALVCCRPGRKAFLAEWLAASVGLFCLMLWMRHLFIWLVPYLALVPALYYGLGGWALRRFAARWPLALAAPAAWMLAELARWYMPPPSSFGWWRLGTFQHDTEWVSGSSRVWGVWGLTWVSAALGGWVADLWRTRGLGPEEAPRHPMRTVHLLGLGPLVLAIALTILVPAPATTAGPRVLLIQPGIEQKLKAGGQSALHIYLDMLRGTAEGLAGSEGPVDLVCWGETMFPYNLIQPDAVQAFRERGANLPEVTGRSYDEERIANHQQAVRELIVAAMFGPPARTGAIAANLARLPDLPSEVLGEGGLLGDAAFVTGIKELVPHGDGLMHRNALALWQDGKLLGTAGKVHLVPAAEDPGIWVHLPVVPAVMQSVGGFVPDFVSPEMVEVLELPRPEGGGVWRIAGTVCYDQVFDDPFADRAGEVDLHLVLSNEAWYEDSAEMDHMLAFARLDAISTGRSVVRATNSGISCVIDPTGHLLGQIEDVDGRRKMVRGQLALEVPVPLERTWTPWARTYRWQRWGWALLLLFLLHRSRNRTPHEG